MLQVKSVETAFRAEANQYVPGAIDALGIFDNIIQPVFPYPMANLAIVFQFQGVEHPTVIEIRVNAPDDTLISQGEFAIYPDSFGKARKIVNLENFLVAERGLYSVDVLVKAGEDKRNFLQSAELFMADYPPKRKMTQEMIQEILATDNVIKMVKTDYKPIKYMKDDSVEAKHFQLFLDKNAEVEEGFEAFPEDDKVEINGEIFDLTGIRRQIEWLFGQEKPAEPEAKEEEKKEEESNGKE